MKAPKMTVRRSDGVKVTVRPTTWFVTPAGKTEGRPGDARIPSGCREATEAEVLQAALAYAESTRD